jgi:hypothetical protein
MSQLLNGDFSEGVVFNLVFKFSSSSSWYYDRTYTERYREGWRFQHA